MAETRARDLANLAGAGATSTTVAYHETARAVTMPPGQGTDKQVISSTGGATTTWETIAVPPEITAVTWYSDSGYSDVLTAAEAVNIDDATYLKVSGTNLLDSSSFGSTAYMQITNQSNAVVGHNQSGVSGCVTAAQHVSTGEWKFTIAPASGSPSISAGDTLKVKAITNGGNHLFTTGYVVSADPTSETTVNSSVVSNAASVGSYGGAFAGGGDDSNTKILLHFDRGGGIDTEDSSNRGAYGQRVAPSGDPSIKSSPFGDGKSAMYFGGGSSSEPYIALPAATDSDDFKFDDGDFCVDFWMNASTKTSSFIWGMGMPEGSSSVVMDCHIDSSTNLVYQLNNTSPQTILASANFIANRWYHVAFVRVGSSSTIKAYIDGVDSGASFSDFAMGEPSGELRIGGEADTPNVGLHGYIDEFRIVKGETIFTADFTPSQYRYGTTGATHEASTASNVKLLIHSNQDATISAETGSFSATAETTDRLTGGSHEHENWGSKAISYGESDTNTITSTRDCYIGTNKFTLEFWAIWSAVAPAWSAMFKLGGTGGLNGSDTNSNFLVMAGDITAANYSALSIEWDNLTDDPNSYQPLFKGQGVSPHVMTADTWYHIVIERQTASSAEAKVWVNGTASDDIDCPTTIGIAGTKEWHIGAISGDILGASGDQHFHIDDLRLVVGSNVYGNPSGTINVPTAPLTKVTNTKFLYQTASHNFIDSATTGTTHAITATGAYHSQGHGGIDTAMAWPASGKTHGSAGCYFDGDGDYLSTTLSTAIGTSSFTLDFWVYYQEGDDSLSFLCDTRDGNNNGFYLLLAKSTGLISFGMQDATDAATATALPLNTWTHLAFERSSSHTTCYFNGARQGHTSNSASGSDLSNPAFRLGIGSTLSGNEFKGYMDEVRLSYTARYGGASSFTVPSAIYGGLQDSTIDNITLTGTPGTGGGKVIYNTATLSGQTETTYALPAGLSISPTVNTTSTTNVATISGDLTADAGTHSIKIVARASSDGSSANIDPNRKQDYTHTITKNSGGDPVLFNGRRYIGDATASSSGGNQISGFGFRPDLVIGKRRNGTQGWAICDSIRGVGTVQTITDAVAYTDGESVLSFDQDGVTFGNTAEFNGSDHQQMLWGFKAGGAPSGDGKRINDGDSNNEVSLTTSSGQAKGASVYGRTGGTSDISAVRQSVNTAGGFSITKWTSTNTGNTNHVPHGFLTTPPEFLMIKAYIAPTNDTDPDWIVWHKSLTTTYSKRLILNTTSAEAGTDAWGSSSDSPDNTSVSLGVSQYNNYNNGSYIMYAWTRKAGVSSFGKYTGSGSTKTVYFNTTGDGNTNANVDSFTPRFIIIKNMDSTSNWVFYDQMRGFGTSNAFDARYLSPDTVGSEDVTYGGLTVTTGGWTMEIVSGDTAQILTDLNTSGDNYIYAAFA